MGMLRTMPSAVVSNASSLARRALQLVVVTNASSASSTSPARSFVSSWSPAGTSVSSWSPAAISPSSTTPVRPSPSSTTPARPPRRRGLQRVFRFIDVSNHVLSFVDISSASSASSWSPTHPPLRRHLQLPLQLVRYVLGVPNFFCHRHRRSQPAFGVVSSASSASSSPSGSLQLVSRAPRRVRLLATPSSSSSSAPTCHLASSAPLLWSTRSRGLPTSIHLVSSPPALLPIPSLSGPARHRHRRFPINFFRSSPPPTTSLVCARRIQSALFNPPSARCRFRWS